ncbi:MAG: cytochrome C biogenesis protein, partial [Propionibacteriales bacterium]|nr:cytochrome C biogenesis protein [Propionibacteriales bacterium]
MADLISGVPASVAFLAGGLVTLNPCGFPVLSAFLAHTLRGGPAQPESLRSQVAHGLVTGMLVTVGFLGVFTALAMPMSFGVAAVSTMVPWLGLAFAAVLFVVGLGAIVGKLPVSAVAVASPFLSRGRWWSRKTARLGFGVGYGVASLGCTLPVFLTLLGAAMSANGLIATLVVYASFGAGTASVLVALSIGAVLAHGGLEQRARRLLPYLQPMTGVLLTVAGGYFVYYWLRVGFGSP